MKFRHKIEIPSIFSIKMYDSNEIIWKFTTKFGYLAALHEFAVQIPLIESHFCSRCVGSGVASI